MALQVWLPLTSDIGNYGLSDITFSNTSTSVIKLNTAGKIGSCFERTNSSANALISNKTIDLGTNQSMFCWINFTTLQSSANLTGILGQHRHSTNTGMGITIRYASSTTGYVSCNTGNGSSRTFNSYYGSTLLSAENWYHIGYTYDGSTIRLYVNGNLDKEQAYTGMSTPADYLLLFNWAFSDTTGTSFSNYCSPYKLNDVRIYDHCLSPREVAEIAKGLVVHYPLSRSCDNIISGTDNWSAWYKGSRWTASNEVLSYSAGAVSWIDADSPCIPWADVNGKTITVSCEVRSDDYNYTSGSGFSLCLFRKSTQATQNFSNRRRECTPIHLTANQITTDWVQYSRTYVNFSDADFTNTYNGGGGDWFGIYLWNYSDKSLQVRKIKIEFGDKATPWMPNIADTAYSVMGYNNNIEYDVSGYGRNITVAGDLSYLPDTPRYNTSINIPNTSTSSAVSPFTTAVRLNEASISFWVKRTTTNTSSNMYIYRDLFQVYVYTDSRMRISWTHATSSSSSGNTWAPGQTVTLNTWKHFVLTFKDGLLKIYVDGAYISQSDRTDTGQFILTQQTHKIWDNFEGQLSDLRVYTTALTADQVMELYNTPVSLANNGTLFGHEFIEEG